VLSLPGPAVDTVKMAALTADMLAHVGPQPAKARGPGVSAIAKGDRVHAPSAPENRLWGAWDASRTQGEDPQGAVI
jgi:hypothetical protein